MKLSLAMIVRDEADMAPDFLESVRGLFDELIVVDTGSSDGTRGLFESAGARVVPFSWVHDFSAARNVSLAHATGDFVLVLDADERASPQFIAECRRAIEQPGVGALVVRISNPLPYGHRRDSWVLRGWKNDPSIRFRHPIHEDPSEDVQQVLEEQALRAVRLEAPIEHLGYVKSRAAAKDKKTRDLVLLRGCLERDPFDFYSRLKLLELGRYWQDETLWAAEARATTDSLELAGRDAVRGRPWAGELIALIAEGLFSPTDPAALVFLDGWEPWLLPSATFLHRRGVFHEHQGHLDDARDDFEDCFRTGELTGDQQLSAVRPRLGLARLALERQQPNEALRHARLALDAGPRDPEALMAVTSLVRTLEGAPALDAWEARHREQVPSCPERDWAIGEAHFGARDYKAAASRFRSAAGVPPGGPPALRLAQALLACGRVEESEALARQLVEAQPEAGLGVLLFDLAAGRDTALELKMSEEAAHLALRGWADVLVASRQRTLIRKVRARSLAVATLFPWLPAYLLKQTA
ncbi:MAG: glycosyltransferase [Myxococcaceae bacterium]